MTPVNMILFCPNCGEQHVDKEDEHKQWFNPPHKSHLCSNCKHIWRPADVPTNGVKEIATAGSDDTVPAIRNSTAWAA